MSQMYVTAQYRATKLVPSKAVIPKQIDTVFIVESAAVNVIATSCASTPAMNVPAMV